MDDRAAGPGAIYREDTDVATTSRRRELKRRFREDPLPAVERRAGARFYVSMIDGPRRALLLGPYASHMTALANVKRGRDLAKHRYPFAAYGTASAPSSLKTAFGR